MLLECNRLAVLHARFQLQEKHELDALNCGDRVLYECSAGEYITRMNLAAEFHNLPRKAVVWDGGCGTGEQTEELQKKYPLLFFGINHHPLPRFFHSSLTVPVAYGLLEEMDGEVARKAIASNRFPPQIIIFSKALPYSLESGTTADILRAAESVLPDGGRILIYEEEEKYYGEYSGIIYQDDSHIGFHVEEPGNRRREKYLRLTKTTE